MDFRKLKRRNVREIWGNYLFYSNTYQRLLAFF